MKKIKEFIQKLKSNYKLRYFTSSILPFLLNIAFLVYNLVFGIIYKFVWNWSISIYYALLILFRGIIIVSERKWNLDKTWIDEKRIKLFKRISLCMIVLDLSLIAPITLMVMLKHQVSVGMIPTIALAAFTTYKVTVAIVNYSKKENQNNLSAKSLRLITLKTAIVSVLTLQNTMVMEFSEVSMLTLTACTSAGMLLLMLGITVYSIVKAHKAKCI